jgi:hypothetical protein
MGHTVPCLFPTRRRQQRRASSPKAAMSYGRHTGLTAIRYGRHVPIFRTIGCERSPRSCMGQVNMPCACWGSHCPPLDSLYVCQGGLACLKGETPFLPCPPPSGSVAFQRGPQRPVCQSAPRACPSTPSFAHDACFHGPQKPRALMMPVAETRSVRRCEHSPVSVCQAVFSFRPLRGGAVAGEAHRGM